MNKKYVTMAGYGAAAAGVVLYLITGTTAGLMFGGIVLCVTSLYKITMDKSEKNK